MQQTLSGLIPQLKQKLSSPFLRNVGWMGMSELVLRIMRLGVTVILARFLTKQDYGLAAIVLAVTEFTRVFTEVGCSAKIIQTDTEDLDEFCNSAYRLTWLAFGSLFIVQCLLSFPIAHFYHNDKLILPICVAALPFLSTPFGSIQYALTHRENRLKVSAIVNLVFNAFSYISSAIFAALGFGMWSIVLPGVVAAPLGPFIYRLYQPWRPKRQWTTKHWPEIIHFGKNILGVQLLRVLRNNLDYLIVGRFIGIEELGIYFFGFNAGLGISLSIIGALSTAILPHLCRFRSNFVELKQQYFSSLKTIACIIIPLVILQSSLAPIYIPFVFGHKWVVAVPILILICLSAIPRPFADSASQLLVAIGRPDLDLRWNVIFTFIFASSLLIGVKWGAIGVATAVLVLHAVSLPLFVLWVIKFVFSRSQNATL